MFVGFIPVRIPIVDRFEIRLGDGHRTDETPLREQEFLDTGIDDDLLIAPGTGKQPPPVYGGVLQDTFRVREAPI